MGGDGAVGKNDRLVGINATGDQCSGHLADVRAQLEWIDIDGQRVKVGEEIEMLLARLGLVLHPYPAQDRPEEVAEVQVTVCLTETTRMADCRSPSDLLLRNRKHSIIVHAAGDSRRVEIH